MREVLCDLCGDPVRLGHALDYKMTRLGHIENKPFGYARLQFIKVGHLKVKHQFMDVDLCCKCVDAIVHVAKDAPGLQGRSVRWVSKPRNELTAFLIGVGVGAVLLILILHAVNS